MILSEFILNKPDYGDIVRIIYSWQTSIKRGMQGNERRTKLKSWPIRSIIWQSFLDTHTKRNLLLRKLFFDFENVYGVPIWPYGTPLTQSASIGNSTIYCSTDYNNFYDNSLVLVTDNYVDYDYANISSFNSTSITLDDTLTNNYTISAMVFPVLQGRVKSGRSIALNHITGEKAEISFEIQEAYEEDQIFVPEALSFPTYNGYYVFNIEPNWSSSQEMEINKPFEVERSIGIDTSFCYQLEADMSIIFNFTLYTAQACNEIESFFNNMAGKYASFWVPTWYDDFRITGAIANTDTTLTIENINYFSNWFNNDLIGRIIFIKNYDGTEVYKKIISAPDSDEIELDSAIGIDVTEDQLKSIVSCFLLPVRFDQDEIEVEYFTDNKAQIELKVYSINDSDMIPT